MWLPARSSCALEHGVRTDTVPAPAHAWAVIDRDDLDLGPS